MSQDPATKSYTFRYFFTGTATGPVTLTFIGNSVTYDVVSGDTVGNFAPVQATIGQATGSDPYLYVDVPFGTLQANGITSGSVSVAGATVAGVVNSGLVGYQRFKLTGAGLLKGQIVTVTYAPGTFSYGAGAAVVDTTRPGRRRAAPTSTSPSAAPTASRSTPPRSRRPCSA